MAFTAKPLQIFILTKLVHGGESRDLISCRYSDKTSKQS